MQKVRFFEHRRDYDCAKMRMETIRAMVKSTLVAPGPRRVGSRS